MTKHAFLTQDIEGMDSSVEINTNIRSLNKAQTLIICVSRVTFRYLLLSSGHLSRVSVQGINLFSHCI